MAANEITLKVDNNVTYVVGKLDSSTYQQFRSYLGYVPEDSFWMLKKSTNENTQSWKKDWDGRISTVHYSKDYCRCFDKKAGTHFPTGLISKAIKFFNLRKINVHQVDIRQPVQRTLPLSLSEEVEQREYQQEVVNKACEIDRGIIKVATGGGKCISENSICLTSDGMLKISEFGHKLEEEEFKELKTTVFTPLEKKCFDETSHIYRDGISQSFKIKTSSGFEIVSTPNHRIIVVNENGSSDWKEVKNINEGDYAVLTKGQELFGNNNSLSIDDSYWFGLLYGDGTLSMRNQVRLTTADNHIESFVKSYSKKNGLKLHIHPDKRTKNTRNLAIYNVSYRDSLFNLGLTYQNSLNKEIPLIIRQSNAKNVSNFIKGLFETDGWVDVCSNRPRINIALSSEKMINQIQQILLNFGIVSHKHTKKTKSNNSYKLHIYNEYLKLFSEKIGFDKNGYKYYKMKKCLEFSENIAKNNNKDVIPNQHNLIKTIYILISNLYGYKNIKSIFESINIKKRTVQSWFKKYNCRMPSRKSLINFCFVVQKLLAENKDITLKDTEQIKIKKQQIIDSCEKIIKFCNYMYYYDKIESKEEIESNNYDFVVPKTNSFVAQGFINHNTVIASSIIANRGVTPTIFYVPSVDLLAQAKSEIEKFIRYNGLKFSVGQLSSVKKEIGDITVMTNQTAVASLGGKYVSYDDEEKKEVISEELKEMRKDIVDLIRSCKLFIGDEVQHWAAETCQIISDASVSAKYRWGISATPFRDKNDDMLIEGCFGRTIADINASFLIERGYLVKPTIYFLPIDMKINAKNYANVYKHGIVENEERNLKIAKLANIYKEKGNNILILCKHISHGNMLESLIPDSIFLHGEHSAKKRKEHIDKIRLGGSNVTIASVIFDEGIDVRSLDTLILAGSGKSPTRALQRVGRILRPFAGKNQVTVFDFLDKCQYLNEHSLRRKQIYKTEPEFEIITTGL